MPKYTHAEIEERIRVALVEPDDDWLAHAERAIGRGIKLDSWKKQYDITTLGGRIRAARELKGMSQADLAKRTGMSQHMVSRAENGVAHLSITKIPGLAISLGVKMPWLLGSSDEGGPNEARAELRKQRTGRQDRILKKRAKVAELRIEARKRNKERGA